LRKVEDVEGYVFRVAHNESQRWLAKNRRQSSTPLPEVATDVDLNTENTEEAEHLLGQLEGVSREILELKFHGGLTFAFGPGPRDGGLARRVRQNRPGVLIAKEGTANER